MATRGKQFLKNVLNIIVSGYMLLIIVIMPFYFQEGYNHIGTDKSYFFRTSAKYAAWIFLPVWALYLLCMAAEILVKAISERQAAQNGLTQSESERQAAQNEPPRSVLQAAIPYWKQNCSVTDFFAIGYALSVGLSYFFSDYRDVALWGEEGWYMGAIPHLILVGIYFAISRFWKRQDGMWYLFLPVTTVVFALGVVNRFGWYPIPMENSDLPEFISTIGNINWYCGYAVAVFFMGAGMFWLSSKGKTLRTGILASCMAVGFATLATQGSDSGVFALAVVMLVLFVLSARDGGNRMERFWQMILILSATCLLILAIRFLWPEKMDYPFFTGDLLTYSVLPAIMALLAGALLLGLRGGSRKTCQRILAGVAKVLCIAVPAAILLFAGAIALNTLRPGSLGPLSEKAVFTFGPEWGSKRGATWKAGILCFSEQDALHRIVGIGPDCMWEHISQRGSRQLLEMVENTFGRGIRLTNAHCEWLTVLADTGILGFVCYAGMMLSAILRYLRRRRIDPQTAICGLCLLAYTANNVWSFQQSMSVATIFVILGMGEAK